MVYDKKLLKYNFFYKATAIIITLLFLNQFWEFFHDDAYIVLTYSRNLLEGNGLTWTAGQRVEGCTQFLWVILIAAIGWFNIDLILASKLLGTFFALSTLLLFFNGKEKNIPLGGLLLATNCCFTFWACGGLEPVACGFFIFSGCTLYLRDNKSSSLFFINGIIFCFAAMTRLEGLLFFGMTFFFILFLDSLPFKMRFKKAVFFALGFLIIFLPYFIWRFVYFGHLFPCPFYAKGGTNIFKMLFGARYLFYFLATFGFPLILILFVKNFRNFVTKRIYLISLLSAYSFYVFIIGGDHMPGFRFFVPILPLFYLLIGNSFNEIRFKCSPITLNSVAILIIAINCYFSISMIPFGPKATIKALKPHLQFIVCQKVPDAAAYMGKHVGIYIKNNWPKDSIIALNAAGAGPYYSKRNCIDMLGLNNYTIGQREVALDTVFLFNDKQNLTKLFSSNGRSELTKLIRSKYSFWQLMPGHGKGDGRYVLSQKPDYIIMGPAEGDELPWFLGDQELFDSQDFQNNYDLKTERILLSDDFHKYYESSKTGVLKFKYYVRKNTG